jgi:hypothetical protein
MSKRYSDAGTRTRVARVRAEYPNQLDYIGQLFTYYWGSPKLFPLKYIAILENLGIDPSASRMLSERSTI